MTRRVGADHPAFDGHFPGRPLWPGVMLLAEVVEAVGALDLPGAVVSVAAAKFLAPVAPDSTIEIALCRVDGGAAFEVRSGGRVVASGRLVAGATG